MLRHSSLLSTDPDSFIPTPLGRFPGLLVVSFRADGNAITVGKEGANGYTCDRQPDSLQLAPSPWWESSGPTLVGGSKCGRANRIRGERPRIGFTPHTCKNVQRGIQNICYTPAEQRSSPRTSRRLKYIVRWFCSTGGITQAVASSSATCHTLLVLSTIWDKPTPPVFIELFDF